MVIVYLVFLGLIAAERLVELRISRRNAASALEMGGIEYGQRHFRFMTVLHTAFLFGCAAEVLLLKRPFVPFLGWPMFALAVGVQALRYWAVTSLGSGWNVRVIVVPGQPLSTRGPYRYIRHPNYLAVIIEGLAIPLIHTAWITAAVFSLANALLLTVRIRCEERALLEHGDYRERFAGRRRFVPGANKEEQS